MHFKVDSSGKIIGTRSSRGDLNGLIRALSNLNDFHDLSKKRRKTSIYNLHTKNTANTYKNYTLN